MTPAPLRDREPIAELRALREQERELAHAKFDWVREARKQGRSWTEIGAALGVTKQAAWEMYNAGVTAVLDRVSERADLSEAEALDLAAAERIEARRNRA